jgi:Domain of unknown function (DUF4410)
MLHRISRLAAWFAVLTFAASLVPFMQAQGNENDKAAAVVVVREFSVGEKAAWPYDVKQLRAQTIAELTSKIGSQANVVAEPRGTTPARLYILDGEIVSWRSGNAAKRILVGMGSGRESADIHYWLTDAQGKKCLSTKTLSGRSFSATPMRVRWDNWRIPSPARLPGGWRTQKCSSSAVVGKQIRDFNSRQHKIHSRRAS